MIVNKMLLKLINKNMIGFKINNNLLYILSVCKNRTLRLTNVSSLFPFSIIKPQLIL